MKNLLPFLLLISLATFGQVPTTGLTAEYKFTNGRLDNAVADDDLSIIGTALAFENNRADGPNKAIALNGDYLQGAGTNGYDLSVSFWIKTSTNDANKRVIIDQTERASEVDGSTETGWYTYLKDGKVAVAGNFQWYHWNNTASGATGFTGYHYTESLTDISDGNWHHIAITIDSYAGNYFNEQFQRTDRIIRNIYYLYIDGNLEGTHNETKNAGSAIGPAMRRFKDASFPLTIANTKDGNSPNRFQESFDDLRYYNTVLNGSQVAQLTLETACSGTSGVSAFTQNITVELDEFGEATIAPEDIDDGSSGEVCNEPFTMSLDKTTFTCDDLGDNIVTLTVTETFGTEEVATANATVTVKYTPTVSTQNITIQLDASGEATITPEQVDNETSTTSICGDALTLSLDETTFSCVDLGANIVTLTADDGNGNFGTATATVTVEDVLPPVIQLQNISVNVDPATGFVTIDPTMINDGSTDNCSSQLTMSLSQTRFSCEDTGDNTVTLTVEDENGNSSTADAIVTVTSEVNNEALTVLNSAICPDGTSGTTISTASSVAGFNYFLRNSEDNAIVDGPIAGTGNALDFATGNLSGTTTFNVFAEKDRVETQTTLDFDGTNDYVDAGSDNRGISNQITVAAWVKTSATTSQFLASKYDGSNGFLLYINPSGKALMDGRGGSGGYRSSGASTTTVNDGKWHYITGTIDLITEEWKIYVDGELENETIISAGTTLASTANFNIGAQAGIYSTGSLSQITVWDVALDEASILANASTCPTGIETGIVAHFTFEDGSGTVLTDHSISAINGTLFNMDPATDWTMDVSPSCGEKACDLQMASEITVGDTELPTILVQDIMAQIDINTGDVTITPDLIDNGSSDNCSTAGNLIYSLDKANFTCEDVGENEVTLTITDESGNEATATATVTVTSAINDETITASNSASFCPDGSSTTISTSSSVVGVNYFLRDSRDNSIVDGPIQGTGSALDFSTGAVHLTTTYNILGQLNKTGSALDFDGVDDYVNLGNINRGVSTEVTMATWIKTSVSGAQNNVAGKFDFVNGWALYIDNNGKINLDGRDGTGTYKQSGPSTTSVNDGQWHYVAGSINVSTGMWKIYVDGVLENSANNASGVTLSNSSLLTFGAFSTSYFTGQIDQFALWNVELDASKITSFNTNCLSSEGDNNLTALFNVDEETGSTVVDNTTIASDGIMVNMDPATDRVEGNLACMEICSLQMTQEITIGDSEIPTAVAQDITVQLDANGDATIQASELDNGSSDNCSTDLSFSVDKSAFTCSDLGSNTVTLTVADAAGNESTATALITVEDTAVPIVTTQNITIQLDETGNTSIVSSDINNGSTDNCTAEENLVFSLDTSDFTCANVGENTVTLTVTDASGNEASATALVTVEDVTVPTAIAQDIVAVLDATGNVTVSPADLDNGSSDLCSTTLSFSLANSTFTCSDLGDNVVSLIVTDESGNQSTAEATITIEDNLAPTISSQNITVQLDATGNVMVDPSALNLASTDNCSSAITYGLSTADFNCSNIGANTVTFIATDESGNESTEEVIITIEDNNAPNAVAQDVTIELDAEGNATISAAEINNGSNDICTLSGNLIMTLDQTDFSCEDLGSNSVTLTVLDESGNSATATAFVTVEDNVAPTVLAQDFTVRLDANNTATIQASDIDDGSMDNCGTPTLSLDINSFDASNLGENTVVLTATDAAGNSVNASAIVTVLEFKQAQTIDFTVIGDLIYGAADQSLSASASSNLAVTFSVVSGPGSVSGSTLSITGSGIIVIEASQAGDDDFQEASTQQSINVGLASLTVTADDQTITYGDAIPTLTYQYAGFVNGEGAIDLVAEPTISSEADGSSDAGTYVITLLGGDAVNYSFTLVNASLVINKADQVITIEPIADMEPNAATFDVVATVGSGMDLSYDVSGPATIAGTTITLDGSEGIVTVTVSQAGDVNHHAASESITFNVAIALGVGDSLVDLIKIYPNPVSEYITIDTDEWVNLKFYGINGQLIKEINQVNGKVDLSTLKVGTYIMEVSTKEERSTVRITKAN